MSTAPPSLDSVATNLLERSRHRRLRIGGSFWPRARLLGEILYHQIDRDRVFTQAAALTYKTLFSLLPIFVLSLLVLSTISEGKDGNALDSMVQKTLYEQLGIDHLKMKDAQGHDVLNEQGQPVTLVSSIQPFIEQAKKSVSNRTTGLVAFGILLYGAISLMIVIESTFNQIYGSVRPRTWLRRIMLYWCVLTLGPIGVAASIVLGHSAYSAASTVAGPGMIVSFLQMFTGFLVSWLLILLMYRIIPDTRVHWWPAIVGSLLAAAAWEMGKWAFGLYVQHAVKNSWYGSLALLPLFMFWIYITWSVVLVGLEITYIQQFWNMLKRQFFFTRGNGTGAVVMTDMRWVLSVGVLLYRQFKIGKSTRVHEAAEMLMLPYNVTTVLLDGLVEGGLAHEVRSHAYALARPPETITAHDLLLVARSLCQAPPELARERAGAAGAYSPSSAVRELEGMEEGWAKTHALPALAGESDLANKKP